MNIVYIHSSYKPNDLIGNWFDATRQWTRKNGGDAFFAIKFTRRKTQDDDIQVGDSLSCRLHAEMFDRLGLEDMFSYFATRKFLRRLDEIKPDIIHLHVVNDCFIHIGLLCNYVNMHEIKVVWTFHDARVLTGMCPTPEYCECNKWKTHCTNCNPERKFLYPAKPIMNLVNVVHSYRKRHIGGIKNLVVATPSKWMAGLVAQSYLKDKRCVVINNGIDLTRFHPVGNNIRKKHDIAADDKILLAVGNPIWRLKGRDYLHKLADDLPQDYVLIMIGCVQRDVEKFKGNKKVLAFSRVDRDELIQFYSAADLFVNPTLADNFPTVNLECQACGTPVVAFDTNGTKETIDPVKGIVVPSGDYEAMKNAILSFDYDGARESALEFANHYSQERCIEEYIKLYQSM